MLGQIFKRQEGSITQRYGEYRRPPLIVFPRSPVFTSAAVPWLISFSPSKMIDDTKDDAPHESENNDHFNVEIHEYMRLRTDRYDAYKWAKDLKLLAYDDIETSNQIAQPEIPDICPLCSNPDTGVRDDNTTESENTPRQPLWQCDKCGQQGRLEGRYRCDICNEGTYDLCNTCVSTGTNCLDASHHLSYRREICEHLLENCCHQCVSTKPFPNTDIVSSFRIVRQSSLPATEKACNHFVAVSYCWPQSPDEQSRGQYTIRDVDGTIRKNRAPERVLDRAMAYARLRGLRFIWIDQVSCTQ